MNFILDYNKNNKTKEELILASFRKLKKIFKNFDTDKKNFAEKLCRKVAFMDVSLDFLQEQIVEEGDVVTGQNGNGFTIKMENPAIKIYNTMYKNYSTAIKQLIDLLPDDVEADDELMLFVKSKGVKK